jgi:hypothetical protein
LAAVTTFTNYAYAIVAADYDYPLWELCGLTSDPGGFFDLTLTNTTTNSGSEPVLARVTFCI